MLLALGAPPGNSRIPMGGGSEWPRAPRLEPEEPRPELPAAAARVRKPVVARGSTRPLQAGSRRQLPGSRWQSSAAPPACHCRRPSTRDRGRRSSGERAWQCAPEPPGVRLWRPRRAWTGRGRASRSQPPRVCPASVSQFCNLRARDLSRSWRSFWFYT